MHLTWQGVTERYDVDVAPPGLHVSQALVNSVAIREELDIDPLDTLGTARPWIRALTDEWVNVHGGSDPQVRLTDRGLVRVRGLRSAVRGALLRSSARHLRTRVEISVEDGEVRAVPAGSDATWLESALGAELLLAQQNDTLRRLKLCRNPRCRVAFYDLSKNNSKVWHDKDKCGAPLHSREYRQRQRQPRSPEDESARS